MTREPSDVPALVKVALSVAKTYRSGSLGMLNVSCNYPLKPRYRVCQRRWCLFNSTSFCIGVRSSGLVIRKQCCAGEEARRLCTSFITRDNESGSRIRSRLNHVDQDNQYTASDSIAPRFFGDQRSWNIEYIDLCTLQNYKKQTLNDNQSPHCSF